MAHETIVTAQAHGVRVANAVDSLELNFDLSDGFIAIVGSVQVFGIKLYLGAGDGAQNNHGIRVT
jgi:hypothetical protein